MGWSKKLSSPLWMDQHKVAAGWLVSIKSYFGAKAFFVCLFVIWTAVELLAGQWVLFSTDKIKALILIRKRGKN